MLVLPNVVYGDMSHISAIKWLLRYLTNLNLNFFIMAIK